MATLKQTGMPVWQAEGLAEDYAHYERGEAAGVSADVERVTARTARSVRGFAADYADAFQRPPQIGHS